MPWININDTEVWRDESNTFQLADIIWITTDKHHKAKGIVEAIVPRGTRPTPEMVEKFWKLNPDDKLYSSIAFGPTSRFDRYIVSIHGSHGDYFIFPANPKNLEQNTLYGRGFVVEKIEAPKPDNQHLLKDYLSKNLKIESKTTDGRYGMAGTLEIKLMLEDEEISSTYVDIPRDN